MLLFFFFSPCTDKRHHHMMYLNILYTKTASSSCLSYVQCAAPCVMSGKLYVGLFLAVDQTCHRCEFNRQWKSQPFIGSTPAGNIHLSAAVYFTGTSFIQMKKVFRCQFVQNDFFVIRISTCNLHFFHYFLKRFSTRLVWRACDTKLSGNMPKPILNLPLFGNGKGPSRLSFNV